jgi:F420-dependent oxidoreductase-like protein
MKVGIQVNEFNWGTENIRDTLLKIAKTADTSGFYSLWVMDHFFQIHYIGKSEEPMLEAYTTLGFLAAATKKLKLGTMVTGVIYRNPGLLVNVVTTLDVLSKGRAYLGIGAAWNEEEARALGFPFPPLKDRFEQLEEVLQIVHQVWKGDESPFHGQHYHMERPMNSPQPISKPHPPILIGGGGEKKTLRLVAQYADACNLFAMEGTEAVARKLDVLKQHCKDVGRDYSDIEKTVLYTVDNSGKLNAKKIIKDFKVLGAVGIQQIICGFTDVERVETLEQFGTEVIAQVSKL